jgi:hypothetical protein
MFLSPGGTEGNPGDPAFGEDDNYGPHCRNCHMGASSCNQCHGVKSDGSANGAYQAYDPATYAGNVEGKSNVMPNAYVHTSAVAGLNGQCIDGGFSWPHRTLGANMLKDELYGVDYDGSAVAPGDDRTAGAGLDLNNYSYAWYQSWESELTTDSAIGYDKWVESGTQLATDTAIAAENLDSVCLDCHGDSTYWNGDDSTYETAGKGWEVLLKGLP